MNFSKRRIKMSNSRLKESNIEWLGKIPDNWKTIKFNALYDLRNEKVSDKDFPPLSVTKMGIVPQLSNAAKTNNGDNRKLVEIGDFAINSRSDRRGSCGISKYEGSVSLINTVLKPINREMNPRYYGWLFKTVEFADEFYKWGHGIVDDLWTTNWQDMKNITLVCPSKTEQNKIADFLDKKVSQIDDISKKIQQEITDLEEYRKSIITKAVTKGLNPNVPMKDSGIPWIGKMPENWKLERVKLITTSLNKGISPNYIIAKGTPIITQAMFSQGYLNFHNIKYGSDPFELNQKGQVKSEDILFATTGGGVLGKVFFVDQIEKGYLASADVCIIRTNNKVFSSKLLYYIFSINYNLFNGLMATGSTNQIHLNMFQFKNMHIPVMPKTDQKKILKFIDQKASKINKLIDKKHKILDFLNQYKQSIIYEYVTGKKQVPTEEGAKE